MVGVRDGVGVLVHCCWSSYSFAILLLAAVCTGQYLFLHSAGWVVPVARYTACEIVWHGWEQQVTAACGVVPVAAIVPVFPAIVHILALLMDHCCIPATTVGLSFVAIGSVLERGGLDLAVGGGRVQRGRGGGAYSFVACLSRLTIDHTSLSRRSTVPTPNRDTSKHLGAHNASSIYYIGIVCLARGGAV